MADGRFVQLSGVGVVASGLLAVGASQLLFPLQTSISTVTRRNPVPWSPRGFGGAGREGKSPVFGVMWGLIFLSQFVIVVAGLVEALAGVVVEDDVAFFSQAGCVGGALLLASVWTPMFTINAAWAFVISSILLLTTAALATTGAIVGQPFSQPEWLAVFFGCSTSFFAGWTLVAAALSVGIVTRAYNRGVNAPEGVEIGISYFPLALAVIVLVLAILFANPIVPAPLAITLFFVPGIFSDWRIWVAQIVCLCAVGVGVLIVFV